MRPDDLKPKQWLIITGGKTPPAQDPCDLGNGMVFIPFRPKPGEAGELLRGTIVRVVAVSIPFLAVEMEGKMHRLDVREVEFAKVSRAYRKAMMAPPKPDPAPDPGRCSCGGHWRSRFTVGQGTQTVCGVCERPKPIVH
jgi:hypothetical protein